jgi:hypothetical protein
MAEKTQSSAPGKAAGLIGFLKDERARNLVFIALPLGLIYGAFFLPPSIFELYHTTAAKISGIVVSLGISTMISAVVAVVANSQDALSTGNFTRAEFFKNQYPSRFVESKLGCTRDQANYLWFQLFDPWQQAAHPQNNFYRVTVRRSSACQLIFHVRFLFKLFCVFSILTEVGDCLLHFLKAHPDIVPFIGERLKFHSMAESYSLHYARLLLIATALAVMILLSKTNRLVAPKVSHGKEPWEGWTTTGCWYLWKEANGVNRQWLDENVLKRIAGKPNPYEAAVALLSDAEWLRGHGYPGPGSALPGEH